MKYQYEKFWICHSYSHAQASVAPNTNNFNSHNCYPKIVPGSMKMQTLQSEVAENQSALTQGTHKREHPVYSV